MRGRGAIVEIAISMQHVLGEREKTIMENMGDDYRMVSNCSQSVDSTNFSTMVLSGGMGTDEPVVQGEACSMILYLDQHQNRRRRSPRRRDHIKLD